MRMLLLLTKVSLGFSGWSVGKESTCNAGDLGVIPGLGRSPGEGNGNPPQYSCLENSMDCIVREVAKSHTTATFAFTLCNIVRELASLDLEAHGNSCYGAWSVPEILDL